MLMTDRIMEAALQRIAETDDKAAELHVRLEDAKAAVEATEAAVFMREDGSVADRKAKAIISPEYKAAQRAYFDALQAWETLKNERTRKYAVIEVWRSWSSARTKGVIT